ncbi:helix-turn-helix domain-containing protein [Paenarthrobacter sp. 2TAF44]|uniref:helix-turn-helix domain-containing protein n=1 Tax=Paenarthrobacter sp. 2TAF44 TaxID=3233018 RepID=UPI003F9E2D03
MPEKTPQPARFLTVEQTAQYLNVGQPLIRALLKTGDLKGIQIGGRNIWRVGLNDVEAYVEEAYRKTAERIASGELDDITTDEDS